MNQQKKIYIPFIVIFAILNIVLIIFVILLYFYGIVKASQDFLIKKQKIQSIIKMEEDIKQIEESLKTQQIDLDKINNLFLISSEIPLEFIKFLEKSALDLNIQIKIISINQEKATKGKNIWPCFVFKISINNSSFKDLLKFINKLETSPYLIEIIKLDIKKMKTGKETVNINTTLFLKVFIK